MQRSYPAGNERESPLQSPSLFNAGIKSTDELFEAVLLLILVVYNCGI